MKKLLLPMLCLAVSCGSGGIAGTSDAKLPIAVDDLFAASGYEGEGATPNAITDANACPQRAGDKKGKCHKFTWQPLNVAGELGWAGVIWQFPANNWGDTGQLGQTAIPKGAQSISFWAWGAQGGETVQFLGGGLPGDGFSVSTVPLALTTVPTQYSISLSKITYGTVIGGFGWVNNVHGSGPVVIYVDDIEWKADAATTATPGCTDAGASNYNAAATADDGTCLYLVTFQVDMTGTNTPPTAKVQVRSTFNGFCADCNLLSLSTGQTWTSALPLKPGTYGFKYATDATQAGFEVVPTACSSDASLTDNDRTRKLVVTAASQTLPLVKFGACP
ncbi:MAG TPA: hypothetical protein VH083_10850 [Myxococcales bacterium]|nr:hypothetical protein [Myxococcales bacterium]